MNDFLQCAASCIAVFSDIHSNYNAFLSCVEDAKSQGVDGFVFLGDYVSGLADTRKTMDLVYEVQEAYPTVCVRGNRERSMLEYHRGESAFEPGSHTGSYLFTYEKLSERDIEFFASLPISTTIEIDGVCIEFAHATTENDRYYFEKDGPKIFDVFSKMHTPYLLTGHSHKQYSRWSDGKCIINPGSVGLTQGNGWHAQYALLRFENGNMTYDLRRVAYDLESAIHAQFASGLVERGRCWAICDLYGAIEGKEYTKALLTRMYQRAEANEMIFSDEAEWEKCVAELNLSFEENDALNRFKGTCD